MLSLSPETEFTFRAKNLAILSAPVGLSYFCQATEVIVSENRESTLLLSLVQAQAYHSGLSDTGPDGIDFGPRKYLITYLNTSYQIIYNFSVFSLTLISFRPHRFILSKRRLSNDSHSGWLRSIFISDWCSHFFRCQLVAAK